MTEDQKLELVERLAEEFTERCRRGEKPSIKEYAERHSELAEIIHDTFPALAMMEDLAPATDDSFGEAGPRGQPALGAARLDHLGDYRIIREVGRGGMGIVYEAEQVSLGRHVAVKVLPKELLQNPKHRSRFQREAKAAAKLHHTNIVPVFGVGEEDGLGYYVMQFIQGLALDEVLEELRRMNPLRGSSGGAIELGRPRAKRRDVSASDVARSLIDGSFQPSPGEASGGSKAQRLLDETMAHQPQVAPPGSQHAAVDVSDVEARRVSEVERFSMLADASGYPRPVNNPPPVNRSSQSESAVAARLSDAFSASKPTDVLSGSSSGTHKRDRKLTYCQSVAQIGVQVADALHYAHGQGVLHRDIKPSNLLLDLRGTVWVTDFGLAKLDDDRGLTQTGDILGTLRYLAPETLKEQADARSEIYSLGLTLYELLALRPAIESSHRHALIDQVISGQIEPLGKRNPEIPRDLVTIVHKAIERDPRHRYQTAQALADDLRRFVDDEPIEARRLSTLEHVVRWGRHNRGLAASLAAVASLVCLLAIGATIAAGYFRSVSSELSNTVVSLKTTQGELHSKVEALDAATGELTLARDSARQRAAENLELAKAAQQNLRKAEAAEQEGRHLLYTTDMRLAPFVWKDQHATAEQLRNLLARHDPNADHPDKHGSSTRERSGAKDLPRLGVELRSAPPKDDIRGFEWHYYKHLLEDSALVFRGHDARVTDAALGPNGQLVTLNETWQINHWNLETPTQDQPGHIELGLDRNVQAGALAPDGSLAALAVDAKVHLLDAATGEELFQFDSANVRPRRLIFSGDGGLLVIVDDQLRWCDTKYGRVVARLDKKFDRVEAIALSADGQTLAVAGHGALGKLASIFRLDANNKSATEVATDVDANNTISAAAVSPDGSLVATGFRFNGGLVAFDGSSGRRVAVKSLAHASAIAALAFPADGTELATADVQGTIHVWGDARKLDAKSEAKQTFKGHFGAIASIRFSANGDRLMSAGADKTARVWDTHASRQGVSLLASSGFCWQARFSPDGQLIAAAENDRVRVWDAATGQTVRELLPGDGSGAASVAFSPDNRLLAVGHRGKKALSYVSLWDIDSGTRLARLTGAGDLAEVPESDDFGSITAVTFSPDGAYLVAAFGSPYIFSPTRFSCPLKVWEVSTLRLIRRLEGHLGLCTSIDFSPRGDLLASGSQDGTAIIWSTEAWKAIQTLENPDRPSGSTGRIVGDVAFSPDGKTLATASHEGSLVLWDVASGKLVAMLAGHSSAVTAVAFSPDGRTLASAGGDETIRLWNAGTRRELVELDSAAVELGSAQSLAFSPDGRRLLAAGSHAACWSTSPPLSEDAEGEAQALRRLLRSGADFPSRIRTLSENLRLHEALARLDSDDPRVAGALAATRANWHAARRNWAAAAEEFDRLNELGAHDLQAWLRTPGLARVARALFDRERLAEAVALLSGDTKRRIEDGARVGFGFGLSATNGVVHVTEVVDGSPAARAKLRVGDVLVKLNVADVSDIRQISGRIGAKLSLTVRHAASSEPEDLVLIASAYFPDSDTDDSLAALHTAIDGRLAGNPHHAGLLELRAAIAAQWSDGEAQVRDYTAAIEALESRMPQNADDDLKRLYRRRGDAYVGLEQWLKARDDYARGIITETDDDALLTNQALAEATLQADTWTVLKPVEATSDLGAMLSILTDDSILASGVNAANDRYRVTLRVPADVDLAAVRLEALTHPTLPASGPGRFAAGAFAQTSWTVTAALPDQTEPVVLEFNDAVADHSIPGHPIAPGGHWNIAQSGAGLNCTAVWKLSTPIALAAGTMLTFEMQFKEWNGMAENLGHFRLSVSSDPQAFDREMKFVAARKLSDPWLKLAAVYRIENNQAAIDQLVERHPKSAGVIGDLFTQPEADARDFSRAVEIYSRGIKPETIDVDLLSKRARAYEALDDWSAASADWAGVAESNSVGNGLRAVPEAVRLWTDFARRLSQNGQSALAASYFERAQRLYEDALRADPGNDVAAEALATLLIDSRRRDEKWTVLNPVDMKSKLGTTFTLQPDGSLLTGGEQHQQESYTITYAGGLPRVTALRLEALPHPRLRDLGPGLGVHGNYHLTGLRTIVRRSGKPDRPLAFRAPLADQTSQAADDGSGQPSWNLWPGDGRAHSLILVSQEPIEVADDDQIVLEFAFSDPQRPWARLGCFRVSVAGDSDALQQISRLDAASIRDPWVRLAAAYAWHGEVDRAASLVERALDDAKSVTAKEQILDDAASHEVLLSALADRRPDDALVRLAWAKCLAGRGTRYVGHAGKPDGQTGKIDLLARAERDLADAQALFARLRADYPQPAWTVLDPTKMTSQGGATLTELDDSSVLADGVNPTNEVYEVVARLEAGPLTAIRLEILRHPSLPRGGISRDDGGQVLLSEFELAAAPAGSDVWQPVTFERAWADREKPGFTIDRAIDGQQSTGWTATSGDIQNHTAIFIAERPFGSQDLTRLRIRLRHDGGDSGRVQCGRFRLSASGAAHVVEATALERANQDVRDALVALGTVYAAEGRADDAVRAFTDAMQLAGDREAKAAIVNAAALIDGMLDKLPQIAPDDAQLAAELARYYAQHRGPQLAEAANKRARELYERQLNARPPDSQLAREIAAELADFLLPAVGDSPLNSQPDSKVTGTGTGTWAKLAAAYRISGDAPASEELLERHPGTRVPTADLFAKNGRWQWAIEIYTKVIAKRANNAKLLMKRARAYEEMRDWNAAAADWASAAARNRKGADLLADFARRLAKHGQPALAANQFKLAQRRYEDDFRADPESAVAAEALADLLLDSLQASDGQGTIVGSLNTIADPWRKLAAAYHLLGKHAELDALCERRPSAVAGIGDVYAAAGDWPRAIAEYTRAIVADTKDADLFAKRAEAYEKQQLWEEAIADWGRVNECVSDKTRRFQHRPALIRRAQLYDRLRQFDQALADYNQTIETPNSGFDPLIWRSLHWAQRGLWKQAADDFGQLWIKRHPRAYVEWYYSRDRALLNLSARDIAGYRNAAAELVARAETTTDPDAARWLVYVLVAAPDMMSNGIRDQLTAAIERVGPWWNPRLNAAVLYRGGELQQAADLFDSNGGGAAFEFLAAMAHRQLGHPDRAEQLFKLGNAWIDQQRAGDPGCGGGVPRSSTWQDWCLVLRLRHEAARVLAGPKLTDLDARLKSDPDNADTLAQRARLLADAGLDDEALRDLDRLAARKVDSLEVEAVHGRVLAGLNRADEALPRLNRAVDAGLNDARVFAARAEVFAKLAQWNAAEADWRRALELHLDDNAIRQRWLTTVTAGGQWQAAARELNVQLDKLPEGNSPYGPRGQLVSAVIRRHDPVYESLLALRPNDPLLPLSAARDFVMQSDWEHAAQLYLKVIDAVPVGEDWYECCAALLLAGKADEYRKTLTRMADRAGEVTDPLVGFALARAAVVSSEEVVPWAKVAEWAKLAAEFSEARGWHWHVAGLAQWRAGNHEQAIAWFDKSAATDWHTELNHLAYAHVYARRGDSDKARDFLRKAREWLAQTVAGRKDGYYPVTPTDWPEFSLLDRELAERLLPEPPSKESDR